jgi:hypothetical protein
MGYKVHTVDGKSGDVSLLHLRTRVESCVLTAPANGTSVMFRPPYPVTITAVRIYRAGGTAGTVAIKNAAADVLAAPLASSTDAWASNTTVQNAAVPAGTSVSAVLAGVTGTPTSITVQIDYTVDIPA